MKELINEEPFFDENGEQIKEFSVLKIFHFTGVNKNGIGRKHYFMYKWIRLKEHNGKKYWVAYHLTEDNPNIYFHLSAVADKETRKIPKSIIVQ